jgi:predicted RNA-binding Zn-ribbon protein involved in translation (DUF1610 family)
MQRDAAPDKEEQKAIIKQVSKEYEAWLESIPKFQCPKCGTKISCKSFINFGYFRKAYEKHAQKCGLFRFWAMRRQRDE